MDGAFVLLCAHHDCGAMSAGVGSAAMPAQLVRLRVPAVATVGGILATRVEAVTVSPASGGGTSSGAAVRARHGPQPALRLELPDSTSAVVTPTASNEGGAAAALPPREVALTTGPGALHPRLADGMPVIMRLADLTLLAIVASFPAAAIESDIGFVRTVLTPLAQQGQLGSPVGLAFVLARLMGACTSSIDRGHLTALLARVQAWSRSVSDWATIPIAATTTTTTATAPPPPPAASALSPPMGGRAGKPGGPPAKLGHGVVPSLAPSSLKPGAGPNDGPAAISGAPPASAGDVLALYKLPRPAVVARVAMHTWREVPLVAPGHLVFDADSLLKSVQHARLDDVPLRDACRALAVSPLEHAALAVVPVAGHRNLPAVVGAPWWPPPRHDPASGRSPTAHTDADGRSRRIGADTDDFSFVAAADAQEPNGARFSAVNAQPHRPPATMRVRAWPLDALGAARAVELALRQRRVQQAGGGGGVGGARVGLGGTPRAAGGVAGRAASLASPSHRPAAHSGGVEKLPTPLIGVPDAPPTTADLHQQRPPVLLIFPEHVARLLSDYDRAMLDIAPFGLEEPPDGEHAPMEHQQQHLGLHQRRGDAEDQEGTEDHPHEPFGMSIAADPRGAGEVSVSFGPGDPAVVRPRHGAVDADALSVDGDDDIITASAGIQPAKPAAAVAVRSGGGGAAGNRLRRWESTAADDDDDVLGAPPLVRLVTGDGATQPESFDDEVAMRIADAQRHAAQRASTTLVAPCLDPSAPAASAGAAGGHPSRMFSLGHPHDIRAIPGAAAAGDDTAPVPPNVDGKPKRRWDLAPLVSSDAPGSSCSTRQCCDFPGHDWSLLPSVAPSGLVAAFAAPLASDANCAAGRTAPWKGPPKPVTARRGGWLPPEALDRLLANRGDGSASSSGTAGRTKNAPKRHRIERN